MNPLAKQLINEDGEDVPEAERCWHYVYAPCADMELLCTGEPVIDSATQGRSDYEHRNRKRGGITCPDCLRIIKHFKAVKL